MSAADSELASMEDNHAVEDEKGSSPNVSLSAPPTSIPSSAPPFPTTTRPNFASETVIASKAVSMASNDSSAALPSPAEASPAKPAVTPTSTLEGTVETSPATSRIASASDSLTCTRTSLINISEAPPWLSELPSNTFGSSEVKNDFPAVLTFKGVSVTLENNSVWKQFYSCGTEMILTKPGRRMFPYCRYRLTGLDPERQYSLVLSIVPAGQHRYRWSAGKWEVHGPAEHQAQGLIRAFSHHYSPCRGSEWMGSLVSFYKLKLTNNCQDQDGHIILYSMHRYIPRLHVIPLPDGAAPTAEQPVVVGPESMTFTFPQTEFMAVTTYQNFRITQLKINHNPFARGFRDDGNNPRLNRITTEAQPVVNTDTRPSLLKPAEPSEHKEEAVDLSMKSPSIPASLSNVQETRLVLKPIMSNPAGKDEQYVPCIRGKHALGELVLVQKRPPLEPKEENDAVSVTPEVVWTLPKPRSVTHAPSTPGSSPGYRKRRRRINRRWANSRGIKWKAAAASPVVVHSPPSTVAMQPELDDVEGLLFVSFTSKEALEVHVRDKPASTPPSASPVSLTTPTQSKQTSEQVEVNPERDEEKIARLEAVLLNDLRVLKHRQVIHPVLQEVGLKLSSLDPTKSIDLQYLGVCLPLPPPNLPEQSNTTLLSPGDEGLPFISRTGKTSDVTKIKGWKNKFVRSKETSPSNCEGLQKNLSAFCSNMLDEYLESEAQQISERAAAFSTNPEGSVAYQLPVKSSSYVKTLDSVLKHRNAASKFPVRANRPCPLSHKPLLYSALTSPAPRLASPATPSQAEAQSRYQSASSHAHPGAVSGSSCTADVSQRLSTWHPGASQRPSASFGQSPPVTPKPAGLSKFQLRLWQMEAGALKQGLSRTQLTPDRLSMALSVVLTKEMLPSQILRVAPIPKAKVEGPECGQEFCRLGCVCSSLQHLNRGPLHCRRPECMFGCACFKRKITKQMTPGEREQQSQPVYSMSNMQHVVQPRPGCRVNKLWNCNPQDVDPEPLFAPKSAPLAQKVLKRSSVPRLNQPIREEDKDPVYKYLESMMTCARVREFNSKPPPVLTIESKFLATTAPDTTRKPQKTTDSMPTNNHNTILSAAEKTSRGATSNESEAKKQIHIQSACHWKNDRKMVLEALCQRMNQNRLSQRFYIGPYCISPVTKIFMQKLSGSILTYRIHISKQSKASDHDEDEFDDSDEEKDATQSLDETSEPEEEDGPIEEPERQFGVTPFLSGVIPAGRLRAWRKPAGYQANGLIQVNGKSYNQARLLLGNMGSLHPANRLAAFVTGRLHAPVDILHKKPQKPDSTHEINTPGTLHIKAAGTVVPPVITARKTTDLKTLTQPAVKLFQTDCWRRGPITLPPPSQTPSTISPIQSFVSNQSSSTSSFQSSSTTSPVSLTVSPSLKSPSFLGQSGTYSFRICPPSNQGTRDQKLPGVTLPGGFTLIQLPNPGADGAAQPLNTTDKASTNDTLPQKDRMLHFRNLAAEWLGMNSLSEVKSRSRIKSVMSGSTPELTCDEKIPSDESDEADGGQAAKQVESNLDIASEDLSSDSSDYSGEGDEDDEPVDIETVEEVTQELVIAKMKEAVFKTLQESGDSSDNFGLLRKLYVEDQMERGLDESDDKKKRKNHTALERKRRSEQRFLFDKLQRVLQSDPRAPRLRLLSLALKEIQNLVKTSRCLEEKKEVLTQMQSVYVGKLSCLSGKSEKVIKCKLKDICERQKMREKIMERRPFFSQLLQSRAALLQATASKSKPKPSPLLQPDFMVPFLPNIPKTTAQNNEHQKQSTPQPGLEKALAKSCVNALMPNLHYLPQAVSSPTQGEVTAPPAQMENQPGEPLASVQASKRLINLQGQQEASTDPDEVTVPNSLAEHQLQAPLVNTTLQVTAGQDGASPVCSRTDNNNVKVPPSQPFALPLIRSKTGRLILPSSLKPIGQGFYTLMVMKAKQKEKAGEDSSPANVQPSDVDSSNNQEKSFSVSGQPLDSETNCNLEDKTASADSDPKCPDVTTSSAECAFINKSILVPLVDLKNSQGGGTWVGLNKLPIARLGFSRVATKPDGSPPVVRRRRGRPRKNSVTRVGDSEKPTVGEETEERVSESNTSVLLREKQKTTLEGGKIKAEGTPGMVSEEADNSAPVKRGRGRPPKNKPALKRAARSPSSSNEDSPVRHSRGYKSPKTRPKDSPATRYTGGISTSRPLTRGALGKDFPSAKKRSWIDVEKELEPDVESE